MPPGKRGPPFALSAAVRRALRRHSRTVQHMRIYHGRGYISMAEQFLDRADISPVF
jgi:hypothetical protein